MGGASSSQFGYRHKSRQIYCPADSLPVDENTSPTSGVVPGIASNGRAIALRGRNNNNNNQNSSNNNNYNSSLGSFPNTFVAASKGARVQGGVIVRNGSKGEIPSPQSNDKNAVAPAANFMSSSHLLKQRSAMNASFSGRLRRMSASTGALNLPQVIPRTPSGNKIGSSQRPSVTPKPPGAKKKSNNPLHSQSHSHSHSYNTPVNNNSSGHNHNNIIINNNNNAATPPNGQNSSALYNHDTEWMYQLHHYEEKERERQQSTVSAVKN